VNTRRGGLGRGLGALIPTGPVDTDGVGVVEGARFEELPPGAIEPNPRQPRRHFAEEAMEELVTSIREVGLLQPIVVREVEAGRYQLVMGERRWRASQLAGLAAIPAIIRDAGDDELLRDALLENLHRQDLNPLEEAAAYQQLLAEFGATHEELASRIGRSRPQVTNTLRLLNLPAPVQRRVAAGVLSAGHARALLSLDEPADQEHMAARIVAEGMSVRAVEEAVAVHGRSGSPRAPARSPRAAGPRFVAVADNLADRFETKVRVELGRAKGKIVVEFASVEDLERILAVMAPGIAVPSADPVIETG